MLNKILNFIKSKDIFNKKNIRFLLLTFFFFIFSSSVALAAESENQSTVNGMNTFIGGLNTILDVVRFIAHPMVMLVGWLLSPDWTFGEIIGLRPILHKMWIYVSNVVYVIFAFMLIFIAFMNIFGESKNYALKNSLPKLIGGILMVPFTWFIVSGILSISNILTASVLTLPYNTIVQGHIDEDSAFSGMTIPKKVVVSVTDSGSIETTNTGGVILIKDLMKDSKGPYNLLSIYAYGIFRIDKMKDITEYQTKYAIAKTGDILKKLTFGMIFAFIFTLLVIALFLALMSRMTMLWLYAIFSPLFALNLVLGGKMKKLEDKFKLTTFLSLAMVPVYVSAALSFGLMFLSLAINMPQNNDSKVVLDEVKDGTQTMHFGDFSLEIKGGYSDKGSGDNNGNDDGIAAGLWDTGKGLISNVIISFIAIAILWMAVMAALGASKVTENAVKPFSEMGSAVGKFVGDLPKYAPIPIPGMNKMSAAGLSNMTRQAVSTVEGRASSTHTELGQNIGNVLANAIGLPIKESANALQAMENRMREPKVIAAIDKSAPNANKDSALKIVTSNLGASTEKIIADNKLRQKLVSNIGKIYNIEDEKLKPLMNVSTVDQFNAEFKKLAGGLKTDHKNVNITDHFGNIGGSPKDGDSSDSDDSSTSTESAKKDINVKINNTESININLDKDNKIRNIDDLKEPIKKKITKDDFIKKLKEAKIDDEQIKSIIKQIGVDNFKII